VIPIFHITYAADWRAALDAGSYKLSTRGRTLEEEGFIHCSYAFQVLGVANTFYRGEHNLVLLVIDTELLSAPLKPEPPAPGADPFPHIYGPLNVDAVAQVLAFEPDDDGTFTLPPAIAVD
jgi:uncharacterized protein (DUF952 family)